jgi:mannose-6-phosphate isomerase-like protein (cupin superfamily)
MEEKTAKVEDIKGTYFYKEWLKREGIPVIEDYYIKDVKTQKLEPWKRKGGLGVYLNLIGTEDTNDSYICEIPPGKSLNVQRHLFEEMIYIVSGNGATSVWMEEGKKQTFEWQAGSLFAIPLNTWHQHFNGSGVRPARYLAVTDAPLVMNLFHNEDFIFNNNFDFRDRFGAGDDYFSGKGRAFGTRGWDTNLIPDLRKMELPEWKERGAGGRNSFFEFAENTMCAHLSEFPLGTYKKAHRHGPGAHVIIVKGEGYTLMWPEGSPMQRFDWHEGSVIVPPDKWFHQHFNTGKEEAVYLAIRWWSKKHMMMKAPLPDKNLKEGGDQIEYQDEDPIVRKMFEEALAKEGIESKMAPYF